MKEGWKVYIKGVPNRGEEVIKMLKDLGGKEYHPYLTGTNEWGIYYINHDSKISFISLASETGKIIIDNYREIKLPEKWKDGDVLVSRSNSQVMVLYEFVDDKDADLFNAYFRIDDNMIFPHSLEVRNHFRLATDQEIERFYENLHKLHKDWDVTNKQLVNWKWKPKKQERYWYIDIDGSLNNNTSMNYSFENDIYSFGNCFKTKEEAEIAAKKIKKLLNEES